MEQNTQLNKYELLGIVAEAWRKGYDAGRKITRVKSFALGMLVGTLVLDLLIEATNKKLKQKQPEVSKETESE